MVGEAVLRSGALGRSRSGTYYESVHCLVKWVRLSEILDYTRNWSRIPSREALSVRNVALSAMNLSFDVVRSEK